MKKISTYILLMAVALFSFQACGPSEEERRAAEQARLDSLRQVQQQQIDAMMKARQDSIAQAQEQQEEMEEEQGSQFVEGGTYAVQVGAFRSEEEAMEYKNMLSDRDYPHIYTVKVGNEETGDVWFRLRVGFFAEKAAAESFGAELGSELNTGYWVSKVQRTGS